MMLIFPITHPVKVGGNCIRKHTIMPYPAVSRQHGTRDRMGDLDPFIFLLMTLLAACFVILLVVALAEWPRLFLGHWFLREPRWQQALPQQPSHAEIQDWHIVLGLPVEERRIVAVKRAYRLKARTLHPDRGGKTSDMARLNEAYRRALKELGSSRS